METNCFHCGQTFEMGEDHECEPSCRHCGATADELDSEYDSDKIAVSSHERECDEREPPEEPINDPEAEFREKRRERKKRRQFERKIQRRRRKGY